MQPTLDSNQIWWRHLISASQEEEKINYLYLASEDEIYQQTKRTRVFVEKRLQKWVNTE